MAHACRGTHRSLLSRISSSDFPGHFAPGPPLCGELRLRFAFHPVMLFEAEVVFEPHQKPFFQLATERLLDRSSRAHLEALNPPRNGATRNVEQIDTFDSRCNHRYPRLPGAVNANRLGSSISRATKNAIYTFEKKYTR